MQRTMPVSGFLSSLIEDYQRQLRRHRNRPFMRATMAACALVAVADGDVSFGERIRVDQILDTLDTLKIFDPHEAVNVFNEFAEGILNTPKIGHQHAVAALKTISGDSDTSALLMRIFLAICESGGQHSLAKQIEVVMLCGVLGIEPGDAGLYIDDDTLGRN